jgi:hypothetical protein
MHRKVTEKRERDILVLQMQALKLLMSESLAADRRLVKV